MEAWRDGGMEGWRDGGMEAWSDGEMEGWKDLAILSKNADTFALFSFR